jgi:hypothetical protein
MGVALRNARSESVVGSRLEGEWRALSPLLFGKFGTQPSHGWRRRMKGVGRRIHLERFTSNESASAGKLVVSQGCGCALI